MQTAMSELKKNCEGLTQWDLRPLGTNINKKIFLTTKLSRLLMMFINECLLHS